MEVLKLYLKILSMIRTFAIDVVLLNVTRIEIVVSDVNGLSLMAFISILKRRRCLRGFYVGTRVRRLLVKENWFKFSFSGLRSPLERHRWPIVICFVSRPVSHAECFRSKSFGSVVANLFFNLKPFFIWRTCAVSVNSIRGTGHRLSRFNSRVGRIQFFRTTPFKKQTDFARHAFRTVTFENGVYRSTDTGVRESRRRYFRWPFIRTSKKVCSFPSIFPVTVCLCNRILPLIGNYESAVKTPNDPLIRKSFEPDTVV